MNFSPHFACLAALATSVGASAQTQLHLTEFLARNDSGIVDEDGERSDWIEIHNSSGSTVNLEGWRLTDDAAALSKWVFPAEQLPAGGYLVVFASGKNRSLAGQVLHTNFRLTTGGEYLALVRPDGLRATEYAPTFPVQTADVSYGLEADLSTRSFFSPPTPGASNQPGGQLLEPVTFSRAHDVVDAAFTLSLSNPEPAATIHYTLDGREPTPADPAYTAPLFLSSTTTVRARAFAAGFLPSSIASATWVFADDVLGQDLARAQARGMPAQWIDRSGADWTLGGSRPGAWYGLDGAITGPFTAQEIRDALRALPTISILLHPDDLFGYMAPSGRDGIYSNSEEEGELWERACSLEWIDPAGGPDFTVDCATSIQGGSSTGPSIRGQLSIDLKFKSQYGPSKLDFRVFEDSSLAEFDYLILDSGNQLSISGPGGSSNKIRAQETRDQFVADLHRRMGHLEPHGRWVHAFLNGLYWGVYHLHERPDERFAAAHGPGGSAEYDWVKRGTVFRGTGDLWGEVRDIVDGGVAPGVQWQGGDAYEALSARVDLVNYVDYLIANWYAGNTDWPQNNWMATARARLSADPSDVNPDGRFVFHVWDAEATLYWGGASTAVGGFYDRTGLRSSVFNNAVYIHTAALEHPDYRTLLADRVQRHMLEPGGALYVEPGFDQAGTVFDPAFPGRNVPASLYHRLVEELGPAVVMEYARWGNYFHSPGQFDPSDWTAERARLLNVYFPIRSGVFMDQLLAATPQLFPDLGAPEANLQPGAYPVGTSLAFQQAQGASVYYTLDGSDPRMSLGSIDPSASLASAPVALSRGLNRVRARAFDGTEWSPLLECDLAIGFRVRINEIQADNRGTVADPFGQFDDWIELRNLTNETLDLTGFHLTDDPENPTKYRIPAGVSIGARDRLVFWADENGVQGPLHVNFKLAAGGEYVGLFGPEGLEGVLLDQVHFPLQRPDTSLARIPDGRGPFRASAGPTPGAPNGFGVRAPR
ncbi:MAG: lamin tail domain-containing protein [Planctomycetota bacterium]|nr:lamin tail domain-containing protein [Planctomycetota bacterium]